MSKVRNKQKRIRPDSEAQVLKQAKRRWRKIRRMIAISTVLTLLGGVGIASMKHHYEVLHDLSVIGEGKPVVVQVHDPKCPSCLKLRREATAAAGRVGDDLLFRVADITTPKGRSLQRKYDVPHVTLLLFDGNGKMRKVLKGVLQEDLLYRTFMAHVTHTQRQNADNS